MYKLSATRAGELEDKLLKNKILRHIYRPARDVGRVVSDIAGPPITSTGKTVAQGAKATFDLGVDTAVTGIQGAFNVPSVINTTGGISKRIAGGLIGSYEQYRKGRPIYDKNGNLTGSRTPTSAMLKVPTYGVGVMGTIMMTNGARRAAEEYNSQIESTGTFDPDLAKARLNGYKYNVFDTSNYKTASAALGIAASGLIHQGVNVAVDTIEDLIENADERKRQRLATQALAGEKIASVERAKTVRKEPYMLRLHKSHKAKNNLVSKSASVLAPSLKQNIPADTTKPTSQSPLDGMDNFDYQEWVTTKGNNYPEREETEMNYFDNPRKVAHALGFETVEDAYERDMEEQMKKEASPTVITPTMDNMPFREIKSRYGSPYIGAALLSAGMGVGISNLAYHNMTKQKVIDWTPSYMNY